VKSHGPLKSPVSHGGSLPGTNRSWQGEGRGAPQDKDPPSAETLSILFELERHRGTLEILALLEREHSATKARCRQCLRPGPEALAGALKSLQTLGLVDGHSRSRFPFGRVFVLTPRGEALLRSPLHGWTLLFNL
jgi:hypothetical protein